MADPRTFVLIGNFTDNITPSLQKINESLAKVKANLESVSKATKPLKQDFKELADLSNKFGSSLRTQATDIKEMTRAMRAMRNEMGRVNRAYRAANRNRNIVPPPPPPPRTPRFATPPPPPPPPRTPRYRYTESPRPPGGGGRGGYGGGGRGGYSAAVGGAVAGSVIGNQAADFLTGAIVKGFQIGVSIMEKPFQYFASALGERIRDEMSDIKAAGGYFSIAKRQDQPFVKTFDQALEFTQKNNAVLAKLAAALPGSTQDYIEVSKRIGDSVARTVMQDKGAAIAYANELRRQFPAMYGGELQGAGVEAQKGAITTLLGELTKKTVLAGQGGRQGAGGAIGPYGLPGLTERMLSQDQVSMGQFQRYSAIFSDPMIMDALQREIPKINATAKNSIDRFKALQKFYDDVLPPEMIEKYRRSIAGLQEAFNTAILGPETGLFGIGRKMQGLGRKINDFGQYVDDLGNVVTDINKAAPADLSVFDMLRDVFANTAQVLMPIIENITLIYDPLRMIGLELKDARHYTAEFLKSFNQYREGLVEYSKTLSKAAGGKLLETKDLRASFAAISNMFLQIGAIGKTDYDKISKQILDPNANAGDILKGLIDTFLKGDAAFKIGEFIGNLVGTVLSEVAKAMGFVTGMATGGPLAKGLMAGFKKAGGADAFASIIRNTFSLLGKLLLDVVKAAPMETLFMAGLLTLPAVISGLISAAITSVFSRGLPGLGQALGRMVQNLMGVKQVSVKDLGNTTPITDPRRMLAAGKPAAKPAASALGSLASFTNAVNSARDFLKGLVKPNALGVLATFTNAVRSIGNYLKGIGPRFTSFFKGFLGKLSVFGAVITSVISLFQGKDLAASLAEGAGPLLGAALGAALIPFLGPIGPMIGAAIGGWVGSLKSVTEPLADGIRSVFGTLKTTFDLLVQIGGDLFGLLNGLVGLIPGVNAEFNLLRFALFAVLSPFKLLEIAINGIYDLYLTIKKNTLGLNAGEQARLNERRTVRATDEFTIQGRQAAGNSLASQKAAEYAKFKEAQARGDTQAMNRIAEYMKSIDRMLVQQGGKPAAAKPGTPAAVTPSKPGIPAAAPVRKPGIYDAAPFKPRTPAAAAPAANPAAVVAQAQAVTATSTNTKQLNQKAATQVAHAAGIKSAAIKTQTNTTTANTTLGNIRVGIIAVSNKLSSLQSAILGDLNNIQAGVSRISSLLASGALKVQADFGLGGGALGGGDGGPPVFGAAASKFGLQVTSGYRPGDPGYHGLNRARDYSNGSGPTPQMQMFAQFMAGTFGKNLKELIYTPLGFSIKNGVKVPPYAQSTHMDHVHVAYALGAGNPAFFSNQKDAVSWEKKNIGPGIKSLTTNTAEIAGSKLQYGGNAPKTPKWMQLIEQDYQRNINKPINPGLIRNSGRGGLDTWEGPSGAYVSPDGMRPGARVGSMASAPINITSPITINQQPGQSADELASIVAMKIGEAVADARAASIFV